MLRKIVRVIRRYLNHDVDFNVDIGSPIEVRDFRERHVAWFMIYNVYVDDSDMTMRIDVAVMDRDGGHHKVSAWKQL